MSAARLFDALPDFSDRSRQMPRSADAPAQIHSVAHDLARTVAVAVAQAEAALGERLAAEHEATLATERERHAERIAEQTRLLGGALGDLVSARMAELEAGVAAHVSATVARLVGGILSDDLRKRSMESLAISIKSALADRDAVRITVSGPLSLYEALMAAMPGHGATVDFVETDGFDLTVSLDGSLFETRLAEWSSALSEILA